MPLLCLDHISSPGQDFLEDSPIILLDSYFVVGMVRYLGSVFHRTKEKRVSCAIMIKCVLLLLRR